MRLTALVVPGHDEVDQQRVERPEVDLVVDEPQPQRRRQMRLVLRRSYHSPSEIAIVTLSLVRARSPSERRLTSFM